MDEFDAFTDIRTSTADCLCYILTLAITLWIGLSFNLKRPNCYIQEFYVPALDLSETTPNATNITNPCLFFDLALTFSYGRNAVIANYTVPSFYQVKGKPANQREVVETHGVPWDDALKAVSNGCKAVFRVDLATRPRFRFWFWYSKKKGIKIGTNVEVYGSGMKVEKKRIRLKSEASNRRVGVLVLFLSLLIASCLFH